MSSHPEKYLSFFFIIAVLVGIKWQLIVALICIFLVANNVKNLFMCLLAACISSLEKCPAGPLPSFNYLFFIIEL